MTLLGMLILAQLSTPQFDRVLVPLVFEERPGAFGTRWTSEVTLFNGGSDPVTIFPPPACPHVRLCSFPITLHAGATLTTTGFQAQRTPGIILGLSSPGASKVAFNVRVRDLSTADDDLGVELPAVRESELLTESVNLIRIPSGPGFRTTLRIYDFDSKGASLFEVRVIRSGQDAPIAISIVPVFGSPIEEVDGVTPGYAELSVPTEGLDDGSVRLMLTPLTSGVRYWAFASTTHNATQRVTIVTPQ